MSKNEVMVVSNEFKDLISRSGDIAQKIEEACGPDGMQMMDLPRIKMPAGASQVWELPFESGTAKVINAVIIFHKNTRRFYAKSFDDPTRGENMPPDCESNDGRVGIGYPGGDCSTCAMNTKDLAQKIRCSQRHPLYYTDLKTLFPVVIDLGPGSLMAMRKYLMSLIHRGLSVEEHITIIGLEKRKSKGAKIDYSAATFILGEKLKPEDIEVVKAYRKFMLPKLQEHRMEPDYDGQD